MDREGLEPSYCKPIHLFVEAGQFYRLLVLPVHNLRLLKRNTGFEPAKNEIIKHFINPLIFAVSNLKLVGPEGLEPTCYQLPFLQGISLRGYGPIYFNC